MHVTERPVPKPGHLKIGDTAGRIKIVSWCARQACVHHADIHRAFDRRLVLRDQTFRRMRLRKAQPMNHDWKIALTPIDRDRLGAMAARARELARPDATEQVASACLEVMHA